MTTMMMSSSFFSSTVNTNRNRFTSPYTASFSSPSIPLLKRGVRRRGIVFLRVNCVSERSKSTEPDQSESFPSAPPLVEPSPESSNTVVNDGGDTDVSSYNWCAALGGAGIGFVETAYLTYLKLTDSDAFCPMGGASCTTILNSDYSAVFGVPLPLIGMFSYGLVAILGLQLGTKKKAFDNGIIDGEMILIGITTSMAVASAYFLYILRTEFAGELCLYCIASAVLSFSLFFTTTKNFDSLEIQKVLGSQLVAAALVLIALTTSYNSAQPVSSSLGETDIPYFATKITEKSSPQAISLARHLKSIGAKVYGAFWCSHCQDQKQMFGREAAKLLDYVECFPDGVKKGGTKMADACYSVKIEGFPTWEINGQVLSGEKKLDELANLSGMNLEDISQSK